MPDSDPDSDSTVTYLTLELQKLIPSHECTHNYKTTLINSQKQNKKMFLTSNDWLGYYNNTS